ncbi:hypothetical protein MSIBF_A3370006 [groundwater metagenome]|uniref:Uncharacterized protein n=1 Tax=groundwater metagenome TaxID=717931 RepID=A0A098EDT7_9ZZZZ
MNYKKTIELMDRVQFIYEMALAKLELESLSAKFEITNSMRKFELVSGDEELLRNRVAYFKKIEGQITDYEKLVQFNQTTSMNQYLTHWMYPYKGKFHPQMIRALLNLIRVNEGDLVLTRLWVAEQLYCSTAEIALFIEWHIVCCLRTRDLLFAYITVS